MVPYKVANHIHTWVHFQVSLSLLCFLVGEEQVALLILYMVLPPDPVIIVQYSPTIKLALSLTKNNAPNIIVQVFTIMEKVSTNWDSKTCIKLCT